MLPLDPKFNLTLCRMNIQNYHAYIDDEIDPQFPPPIDTHNRVVLDNPGEDNPKRQPPAPRPPEYYMGNVNIVDSYGPLVLPPLP